MPNGLRRRRATAVAISLAAYLIALAAAYLVLKALGPLPPLAAVAGGTGVATVVIFLGSVMVNNSSLYDPYWSLQPLGIAVYYLWLGWDRVGARGLLVAVLVFLYALRLTTNFYRDWPGFEHEDFRYRDFRRRFGRAYWLVSFLGIHLFPTIMVYLGCLPLYAVYFVGTDNLGWLDLVAAAVLVGAVGLALVADEQLRRFRREPNQRGRLLQTGLWAYSRHPNYLGEILTWWGLWLFAVAAAPGWWWAGVGAVAITSMFVLVSVPLMEKRMMATRAEYHAYREATPMLLPALRRRRPAPQAKS